jgi:predicted RNase H-like nuclease (RuvC/YqgF family)
MSKKSKRPKKYYTKAMKLQERIEQDASLLSNYRKVVAEQVAQRRLLRNRIIELEDEISRVQARVQELSHQVVKMDARAVGSKLKRLVQVVKRELNR